jgi:hypothetical protein
MSGKFLSMTADLSPFALQDEGHLARDISGMGCNTSSMTALETCRSRDPGSNLMTTEIIDWDYLERRKNEMNQIANESIVEENTLEESENESDRKETGLEEPPSNISEPCQKDDNDNPELSLQEMGGTEYVE